MTTQQTPRNAQDAIGQALRLERARKIIAEGYTFSDMGDGGIAICKPGELAASYWINSPFCEGRCSCPDADAGNVCKHTMAWQLIQAEQATEQAGYEEQCRRHDAEHGPDMPQADTLRALILAEYRKAERNLAANPEPFSTRAEASRTRMRDCETALKIYDEVACKIACDYYKRNLDRQRA